MVMMYSILFVQIDDSPDSKLPCLLRVPRRSISNVARNWALMLTSLSLVRRIYCSKLFNHCSRGMAKEPRRGRGGADVGRGCLHRPSCWEYFPLPKDIGVYINKRQ